MWRAPVRSAERHVIGPMQASGPGMLKFFLRWGAVCAFSLLLKKCPIALAALACRLLVARIAPLPPLSSASSSSRVASPSDSSTLFATFRSSETRL